MDAASRVIHYKQYKLFKLLSQPPELCVFVSNTLVICFG